MMKNAAELELCTLALVALRFFVGDLIAPSALSQLGFLVMHMLMETQLECFRVCVLCFMFSFVVCVFYVIDLIELRPPACVLLIILSFSFSLSFLFLHHWQADRPGFRPHKKRWKFRVLDQCCSCIPCLLACTYSVYDSIEGASPDIILKNSSQTFITSIQSL